MAPDDGAVRHCLCGHQHSLAWHTAGVLSVLALTVASSGYS
jgi:hypothetical protein